jgi:hypothetical protein
MLAPSQVELSIHRTRTAYCAAIDHREGAIVYVRLRHGTDVVEEFWRWYVPGWHEGVVEGERAILDHQNRFCVVEKYSSALRP